MFHSHIHKIHLGIPNKRKTKNKVGRVGYIGKENMEKIRTHPKDRTLHPEARMMPSKEGEFLSYFPKIKPCIAAAKGKKRGGKWGVTHGDTREENTLNQGGEGQGRENQKKM